MKRALIIVLVSTCLLGLVGCDPGMTTIDGDELLKNTVKIELYNYENTSPKLYELNSEKLPIFDFSKATFIAELDKSHFEDMIKDIAKLECLVFGSALNEPVGKTMILYQENGNMVVLFSCVYKNGKNSQDIMESATYSTKMECLLNTLDVSAAIMLIHWKQTILEVSLKQIPICRILLQ